jgi:L-fuculose-phosphate aldolase
LLEGDLPPIQAAVVAMHTAMYEDRPDVGCVLHTHSPYATAYAVAGIRAAMLPGVPAVLLANHGVLVFHRTPDLAITVGGIIEEAAQAGINAGGLGGPVEIPVGLRAAALQRAMTFDSRGTAHA